MHFKYFLFAKSDTNHILDTFHRTGSVVKDRKKMFGVVM